LTSILDDRLQLLTGINYSYAEKEGVISISLSKVTEEGLVE
jgi:hypothetical protein